MQYESSIETSSKWAPTIRFRIERMSFSRRLELAKQVRGLLARQEFHASSDTPLEQVEASALSMEIDALYWDWGLIGIEGLTIDNAPATKQTLLEHGPEILVQEILTAIKRECGLNEEERKN